MGGRYPGGLYVGKFLKVVTCQSATREASGKLGAVGERAGNYEDMLAHGISCKVRVAKGTTSDLRAGSPGGTAPRFAGLDTILGVTPEKNENGKNSLEWGYYIG